MCRRQTRSKDDWHVLQVKRALPLAQSPLLRAEQDTTLTQEQPLDCRAKVSALFYFGIAGHYCPNASTSGADHDNTFICPAGYLCPEKTPVDPTASGDTYKCPKGYYCLQGATAAIA